jgi:hypothetical protein
LRLRETRIGFGLPGPRLGEVRTRDFARPEAQSRLAFRFRQFLDKLTIARLELSRRQHLGIGADSRDDGLQPRLFGAEVRHRRAATRLIDGGRHPPTRIERQFRRGLQGQRIHIVRRDPEKAAVVDPARAIGPFDPQERVAFRPRPIQPGFRRRLARIGLGQHGCVGEGIGDGGGEVLRHGWGNGQGAGEQAGQRQGRAGSNLGGIRRGMSHLRQLKELPGLIPSFLKIMAAGQKPVKLA